MKLSSLPAIEIMVDGAPLSQFSVISITINQHINDIPSANIILGLTGDIIHIFDHKTQEELTNCRPNSEFVAQIEKEIVFKGIIVRQQLELKGQDSLVILTAKHPLQKLTHGLNSQLFSQQSDEEIIRKLFNQAGIPVTIKQNAQLRTVHEQMAQFRCNNWVFLRKRLNATNTWMLPGTETVTLVTPESLNQSTVHTLSQQSSSQDINIQEDNHQEIVLFEASLQWDNQYNPETVNITSWDIVEQELSQAIQVSKSELGSGQLASDNVSSLTNQGSQWIFSYSLDNEQTLNLAQGILNNQRIHNVSGRFYVAGDNRYQAGDILELTGFGQAMDGRTIITGVNQSINQQQGWRTQLTLGMQPEARQPASQVKELHIGIVEKFQEDSQSLDRIPIKIPAFGSGSDTLFARLSKPYASNESGFCFYPEPGDEVIIGFFECNPDFPVILGSMHNPKNKTPLAPSEENSMKTLVIRQAENQQSLIFNNKEKIISINSGEHKLSLQQDKDITFDSVKNLIMTATEEIKLQAEESLSASGQSGVDIKGANINLTQ
ncbi:phage baseplate assembly protein V [Xenorhabdus ishibashii]|uniref:Gp5/Type VI secretion system Vgr protein OB-fold domain-containing protein n=1 Tax=Xenorhabdus ishibashii TaxID=1034471 RepID=A0A2D0KAJ4_9GAMM|nr:phage baseplate assembly protein V [Xenorhabdus ishibashii]PHM60365.1 hypothetical protein Xish_03512 [Xenorhabdus ishibashii]